METRTSVARRGSRITVADVTVALSRLPIGHELGLRADSTIASAGISIGTATLYDRTGPVGMCTVTALSNARRQIDFSTGRFA